MVCSCATDLQTSSDQAAFRRTRQSFEVARAALRGDRQGSFTCFLPINVLKRKDEQRECQLDAPSFRGDFREQRARYSHREVLALSIVAPDHLIELPGTP